MTRIAINGFGRLGRMLFKLISNDSKYEIVAINDPALNNITTPQNLISLFKHEYNSEDKIIEILYNNQDIVLNDKTIKLYNYNDITKLPWYELDIDYVFECTGITNEESIIAHIESGAKSVICYSPIIDATKAIIYTSNNNHDIDKRIIDTQIKKIDNNNTVILVSGEGMPKINYIKNINDINIVSENIIFIEQKIFNKDAILDITNLKLEKEVNNSFLESSEKEKIKQKKYFDNHMINQKLNKSTLIYRKRV